MTAYFDYENLVSYLKQPKDDNFVFSLSLLKKHLDIRFNFGKEKFKDSDDLLQFLKVFTSGVSDGDKIKFLPTKFPPRNVKSNTHKDFSIDEMLSVYFINDEDLHKLKNKEELLIADKGEEMDMFKMLFLQNDDYKFEKKLRIGSQFKNWNDLRTYYGPYTDLIIVDNFILGDISLFETNLIGIIKNTLKDNIRKKINIIIFLKPDQQNVDFTDLRTKITTIVQASYTDSPNITLVKHYAEHDRTVLKNFIRIYSGDTFNYFLSNGTKNTKGKEIHFSSIADKENYSLYIDTLNDLQKIIDGSLPKNIEGNKVSKFLKFQ